MSRLMETPLDIARFRQSEFFDDFHWYISPHFWTSIVGDSGSVAVGDAVNGILTITPSDGSVADNDQSWIKSTNEFALFTAGYPLVVECLLKFTEAATNAANIAFGFKNAVADDDLADNGAGMPSSFSGAAIYKVDGSTVWKCISSVGSTQTNTTTTVTAGGAYQRLRIEVKPTTSSLLEVTFFIDGQQVLDTSSGRPGQRLVHTVDPTSSTEMQFFVGAKNGTAAQQTCLVDYFGFGILRQ